MRRLLLPAGAFLLALLVGAWAADALRSEDLPLTVPPLTGEVIPLLAGEPITSEEDLAALEDPARPWEPAEVAAEYHPVDLEAASGSESVGGPGDPGFGTVPDTTAPAGDGAPGEPGEPVGEGDSPPPDPGFDFEIDPGLFGRLLFDEPLIPWARFLDFCADHGDDAVCPPGVGGTVLADYDGPGDPGVFSIQDSLYIPGTWERCPDRPDLRPGQYPLMIMANQPSRMTITYRPSDGSGSETGVAIVDTSVAPHPELGRWLDLMLTTGGPAYGRDQVHHCFVLDGGRAQRSFTLEVTATSITGETDTARLSFLTSEERGRPPVTVAPLAGYKVTVAMPVQGDGEHYTVLRAIEASEGLSCTDIESAAIGSRLGFGGGREWVVPLPETGYRIGSGYSGDESMGEEIVSAPDWPYDPAYDTYQFWSLNLREGRGYLICMWWMRSPTRSFDASTVAERESRWVITPDRRVTRIEVQSVWAPTARGVDADSIRVSGCDGSRTVPAAYIERGGIWHVPRDARLVCDYQGYAQPDVTVLEFETTSGLRRSIAVGTSPDAEPGLRVVFVTLDEERASGLCGSSFGPCDPPTTVYPGPEVALFVETYEGAAAGWDDWFVRGPESFAPAPTVPTVLPAEPRLDMFNSGVEAEGRDRVRVELAFDRPVRISARIYGADDDPCLLGERREQVVDEFRQEFLLYFEGLCTLREYAVNVTATDHEGETVTFAATVREGDEGYPWYGWVTTEGWPVRYIVGLRNALGGDSQVHRAEVMFSGSSGGRVDLRGDDRCLVTTQSLEQTAQWREQVTVQVEISFTQGSEVDGYCRGSRYGQRWTGSVSAEVSLDDLRAGPISIPVTVVNDRGDELSGAIAIRITGSVGGY